MPWIKPAALLVIAAMLAFAAHIVINGSLDQGLGMDRFLAGMADPWTLFIGFDLMAGLFLAAVWIVWRQRGARALDTVAWVLCLTWWGNIVTAAYLLIAAAQSGGDPARFFMGERAGPLRRVWQPGWPVRLILLLAAGLVAAFAASRIAALGLAGLPGQAYIPGFAPIILGLILLAVPARSPANAG